MQFFVLLLINFLWAGKNSSLPRENFFAGQRKMKVGLGRRKCSALKKSRISLIVNK